MEITIIGVSEAHFQTFLGSFHWVTLVPHSKQASHSVLCRNLCKISNSTKGVSPEGSQTYPEILEGNSGPGPLLPNRSKEYIRHDTFSWIITYFLRDNVEKQNVVMKFCKTEDRLTDIFTKSLSKECFIKNRMRLGMHKITQFLDKFAQNSSILIMLRRAAEGKIKSYIQGCKLKRGPGPPEIPISQEVENPSSFNFSFPTPEGCKEISCEKGESWNHLFEPPVPYLHEPEVREFFYKMELLESGGIATTVRNVETCLDEEILGIILGVPVEGIQTIEGCKPSSDFTKLATKRGDVKNAGLLKRFLKGEYQLLFEFINKVLVPRTEKRTVASAVDLFLMEKLDELCYDPISKTKVSKPISQLLAILYMFWKNL
ncbi:hypothetical protein KY290_014117 [Solanum tuberosum]|uniref:Uncharacterized protein n=1 Tax=Solanum tuberosum TaxID=4113 RepID=A0ABQ7VNR8_SOLTU|nr:hypothetical protein KY289_014200 [Solanum tuberosum]KAH0717501.1 hypothetical protein KY285_013532 [Solanum tuberosum]KAH0770136.1 hypothetical protein KY290_014117 [Solanum tuberosum]